MNDRLDQCGFSSVLPIGEARAVRYFTDGLAIGSKAFVSEVFAARREHFGPKRMSGARALRGVEAQGLCALRDLRLRAIG